MDIVNPQIVDYLLNVTPERDDVLEEMEQNALERTFPIVGPLVGRLLISDNVFWSGKVLNRKPDRDTAGILTYNRLTYSSKELFTTIIPLRDGLSVSIKR